MPIQSLDKLDPSKILDSLLPYNLQNLPERFKVNLMGVIERKLSILSRAITTVIVGAKRGRPFEVTYLSYISILRTAHKESYGDLSMLISHALRSS